MTPASATHLTWAALMTACLIGCASPPDIDHPDLDLDVPETWSGLNTDQEFSSASTGPSRWWNEFADAELNGLISRVLENNHDLARAALRVELAAASARISGADSQPTLDAGFDASRRKQNFIGLPIPGSSGGVLASRATSVGLSLNLRWELDVWGRLRAKHSASLADVQAAEADAYAARLSIVGQTVKLWLSIVESRRQVTLAQATYENVASLQQKIDQRYQRGVRTSLDVRLAKSDSAVAKANLDARRRQLDRLLRQLDVLAGKYPDGRASKQEELPTLVSTIPSVLPAEIVSRRPDLAAAERKLAAAGARIREARSSLYPRFSLTASGGTSSTELSDLLNGNFGVWSLAGNLAQPLLQGGRLLAGVDLAKTQQRVALHDYVQSALIAFSEVESTLAADSLLRSRETALAEATQEASDALRESERRYDRGLIDIITLLSAQNRAFSAESQWIMSQRELLDNRVDLHLALGGDFHHSHPSPSPEENHSSKENQAKP